MSDDQSSPDPRKVTVLGGIVFNPWVNTAASLICTIGLGWMTLYFWGIFQEVQAAPAYPDQGLDLIGVIIGLAVGGLATIALFFVTIFVVIWWAKRGWRI